MERRRLQQRLLRSSGTFMIVLSAAAWLSANAYAQGQGKGNGGGGGADKDLPVCITFVSPDPNHTGYTADDLLGPYCDSDRRTTAIVGRGRSIWLALDNHNQQSRRFDLVLGSRLPDVVGDPDPNNDGGILNQPAPGDWSNHEIPMFVQGVIGEFPVAYRENVLNQGEPGQEPNPMVRSGRIRFVDEQGRGWGLYWGKQEGSGGDIWVNTTTTKGVQVTRRTDGGGNLINEWEVVTLGDDHPDLPPGRYGKTAAFLWRDYNDPNVSDDYYGVFDVWFAYEAVEEP